MMHDSDTFEREGIRFKVTFPHDDSSDAPWDREDGHGPVSDWRGDGRGGPFRMMGRDASDKKPGEVVLIRDGGSRRYYDWAAATALAKRDGWGLGEPDKAKLAARLRKPLDKLTQGEVTREAVQQDFDRLRGWCDDRWSYVGVVVKEIDEDDEETGRQESVWGIESDCTDYLECTAFELADQIISERRAEELRVFEYEVAQAARIEDFYQGMIAG